MFADCFFYTEQGGVSGVHRGLGFSSEYNAYFAKPTFQVVHCTLYPRIAHSSHSTKVRNATNDPPATSSHRVGPQDPHISRSHVRPTAVPSHQSCYSPAMKLAPTRDGLYMDPPAAAPGLFQVHVRNGTGYGIRHSTHRATKALKPSARDTQRPKLCRATKLLFVWKGRPVNTSCTCSVIPREGMITNGKQCDLIMYRWYG